MRNYDAAIGRWLSVDPYGQYASPYLGMGNNPVSGTDPDGGWDDINKNSQTSTTTITKTNDSFNRYFLDGIYKGWGIKGESGLALFKNSFTGNSDLVEFGVNHSYIASGSEFKFSSFLNRSSDYLIYDAKFVNSTRTQGSLNWYNSANKLIATYPAVSGSGIPKYFPIPEGDWSASYLNSKPSAKYTRENVSFRVTLGADRYDPRRGRLTGDIRIHPARSNGTEGCIGLIGNKANLLDFYNRYSSHYHKYGSIPVQVRYASK